MELDGLGDRCSLRTCRKLDFLPLKCPHCASIYCATHYPHASHSCRSPPPSTHVPTCPICSRAVPQGSHASPDVAMSVHIDSGCPSRTRANARCEKPGCNARDVAPVTCRACSGTFCLEHRIEVDHDCKRTASQVQSDGAPSLAAAMRRLATSQQAPASSASGAAAGEKKKLSLTKRVRSKSRSCGGGGAAAAAGSGAGRVGSKDGRSASEAVGATAAAFVNTPSSPRRAGTAAVDSEDEMHLAVYFCGEARRRPEFWTVNRKWSAGKVLDGFKLPALEKGQRYALYAVRKSGDRVTSVNLLPRISPLREHGREVLTDGDCVVVEIGENGLRDGWLDVLGRDRALSKFKATRISSASSSRAKCIVV